MAGGPLLLLLQFLTIFLCKSHCFLHVQPLVVPVGLNYGLLQIDVLTHALQVRQDLSVISNSDAVFAGNDERKGESVGIAGAVLSRHDAFP